MDKKSKITCPHNPSKISISNMEISNEVQGVLELDISQLFSDIGATAPQFGFGMADQDDEEKGRTWFQRHKTELREKVCGTYLAKLAADENGGWDRVLIVAGIADLIANRCVGVSPLSVAALILKLGLNSLCQQN
ncbi:hypothetical protein [Cerasicoccus frondis]|uniref:hypothetical protein n=1 Tax=Cerasicoccus frondis TaxID=490090 RepID=UPI00285253B6|nr:hypothetical protein [Cerasicoccus frondis]